MSRINTAIDLYTMFAKRRASLHFKLPYISNSVLKHMSEYLNASLTIFHCPCQPHPTWVAVFPAFFLALLVCDVVDAGETFFLLCLKFHSFKSLLKDGYMVIYGEIEKYVHRIIWWDNQDSFKGSLIFCHVSFLLCLASTSASVRLPVAWILMFSLTFSPA